MQEIEVRETCEDDIPAIRDIFKLIYKDDYPYDHFYSFEWLKHSIYNDGILLLTALDQTNGEVLGTASVVFEVGGHNDLVAEFGRLVVRPDQGGRGIGRALMNKRLDLVKDRIHIGIVENRTPHPRSQVISRNHGFHPVGFLPQKHLLASRESMALFCQHFGNALQLRRNNPRIIPEVQELAFLALSSCGLAYDPIIDEDSRPYPPGGACIIESLQFDMMPALLRIERGRVRRREVFGPLSLHNGYFRIHRRNARYILARHEHANQKGALVGALGYLSCPEERSLRIIEVFSSEDSIYRLLLQELMDRSRERQDIDYIEIDVIADAPRMQRTLLELGFVPTAYIPAGVFDNVERLDIVKMCYLLVPFDPGPIELIPEMQAIYNTVARQFKLQFILPDLAQAIDSLEILIGMDAEQKLRLASVCDTVRVSKETELFSAGEPAQYLLMILEGEVEVFMGEALRGRVGAGEALAEISTLTEQNHRATVRAASDLFIARLGIIELHKLSRQRPDIALILYRNLARGLGRKLYAQGV